MKNIHLTLFFLVSIHINLFSQIKHPMENQRKNHMKNYMKNQIVEAVVYKIKPETDLNVITQKVNQEIAHFEGFVSRQTFQSVKDSTLLMDWVVWESLEQAQKASQELPQKESLAPFM